MRAKKRKLNFNNESTMTSNLFTNFSDLKQFCNISKQIQQNKWVKSMYIPNDIIKEIAEFSTGTFKDCSNYECKNNISILQEVLGLAIEMAPELYKDEDEDDDMYTQHKFMIYKDHNNETQFIGNAAFNEYYCLDCMDKLHYLCKNYDCDCKHVPSLVTDSDRCNKCDKPLTNCEGCDSGWCYCKRGCVCCGNEYCAVDAQEMLMFCEACGMDSCASCMTQIYTEDDDNQYVCSECCCDDQITVDCDKCGFKCKLVYEGNCALYAHNKETNIMELCMEKCFECDEYVCFNCYADKRDKRKFQCKTCGPFCLYIGAFCSEHQPNKGKCYKHSVKNV